MTFLTSATCIKYEDVDNVRDYLLFKSHLFHSYRLEDLAVEFIVPNVNPIFVRTRFRIGIQKMNGMERVGCD